MAVKFEGLDVALKNLNAEISGIKGRTTGGLMAGGFVILGTSNRRVPVEYGNLRASGYVRRAHDIPDAVEIGYTASYALSVHENMEQKLKGRPRPSGLGVYWGPHGQPKFLESAARDESDRVVEIVAEHASVKKGRA